jgi:hypothetical protein
LIPRLLLGCATVGGVSFPLAAFLACTSGTSVGVPAELAVWTPPTVDDTHVTAAWSADEAADALARAAVTPLPAPGLARDRYLALMALGDATCPGDPLQLMDTLVPLDGCTAASGVSFHGISRWLSGSALSSAADPASFLLYGDLRIVRPDGEGFEVGGFAGLQISQGRGLVARSGEVSGSWYDAAQGEGWLGEGLSATLSLEHFGTDGAARARVSGGVSRPSSTVYFDELRFDAACGGHPVGAVSVRDPSGGWWRYVPDAERCDGCGDFAFEEGPADVACIDLRPLVEAVDLALDPS